jgi:hypothetical protein
MKKSVKQTRQITNKHKKKAAGKRGAMVFEQEDIQLFYRALRAYQPTAEEAQRHELFVEQFEEILAVDFELLEIPY